MDKAKAAAKLILIAALRGGVFVLGLVMFLDLTEALSRGAITYSVGEVSEERVTTSGWADTLAVYFTFSPITVGLMILGIRPELLVEHKWLCKALLGVAVGAYICTAFTG